MRSFLTVLLLGHAFLAPTNAQKRPVPKDTIATRVRLPGADCALFPAAASFTRYLEYTLLNTGRFTPTRQQVAMTEKPSWPCGGKTSTRSHH